jgi:subtilisin family serine protease
MSRRRLSLSLVTAMLAVTISSYPSTHAADANGDDFVGATQLIVRLDPATVTIDDVNAFAGSTTAATSSGIAGSYLVNLPVGADPAATAARIDTIVGVDWVAPNTTITPPEVDLARIYAWRIYAWTEGTPVPGAGQYAAPAVNLAAAQQLSTGSGVTVAVLDTGVQLDPGPHPLLGSSLVPGIDLVDGDVLPAETRNGIDDDGDGLIDEGIGHGTHVAGIVHQVAPGAKIMPVRILDDDGSGTTWNAAEGMFWAAQHGAKVINMSLGTHGSPGVLRDAVQAVSAAGVLVVAAAGNDGKDRTMYPAAAPEAIAVGSVGAGDVVSTFSNFGRWVDVVAPGENIHSSYAFPAGSYASNSGTSMATPWVAGEAAMLLSHNPGLSPAAASAAISGGAHSVDAANPSKIGLVGAGRIDLLASLLRV